MADIINLRLARKRKARVAQGQHAVENRALYGRPKADRDLDRTLAAKSAKRLDGHKRGRDDNA